MTQVLVDAITNITVEDCIRVKTYLTMILAIEGKAWVKTAM